ncbi:MAG TPA: cell division topological specificity factor MinE [Castellaniella sp.]|nr:cell division topological specificity factor MinE [Castellaniella sp.]
MSFFDFLKGQKKNTASIAKNRLQLILINERGSDRSAPDFLPQLQRELIEVISRYVHINPDDIKVNLERQDSLDVLEVKIEMPQAEALK